VLGDSGELLAYEAGVLEIRIAARAAATGLAHDDEGGHGADGQEGDAACDLAQPMAVH